MNPNNSVMYKYIFNLIRLSDWSCLCVSDNTVSATGSSGSILLILWIPVVIFYGPSPALSFLASSPSGPKTIADWLLNCCCSSLAQRFLFPGLIIIYWQTCELQTSTGIQPSSVNCCWTWPRSRICPRWAPWPPYPSIPRLRLKGASDYYWSLSAVEWLWLLPYLTATRLLSEFVVNV
jgi:hypothetical protein